MELKVSKKYRIDDFEEAINKWLLDNVGFNLPTGCEFVEARKNEFLCSISLSEEGDDILIVLSLPNVKPQPFSFVYRMACSTSLREYVGFSPEELYKDLSSEPGLAAMCKDLKG